MPAANLKLPWTSKDWSDLNPKVINWIVEGQHGGLIYLMFARLAQIEDREPIIYVANVFHHLQTKGQELNIKSQFFGPAVYSAALIENEGFVRQLLEMGADVNFEGEHGNALLTAALFGNDEIVKLLLKNRADAKRIEKVDGMTGLTLASFLGRSDVVKFLLMRDASIDAPDKNGQSALHIAVQRGHETLLGLLLKNGADINKENANGRTALYDAACRIRVGIVQLLLENGADGAEALTSALLEGSYNVAATLIRSGVNINGKNRDDGGGLLYFAVERGSNDMLHFLLKNGADVNITNPFSWTPLHFTARWGHETALKMLLESGANIDCKSTGDRTALHLAADQRSMGGWDLATDQRRTRMVELLLRHGANPDSKDQSGETTMHQAARYNRKKIARVLLDQGATVDTWGPHGNALIIARDCGHEEMASLLQERQWKRQPSQES